MPHLPELPLLGAGFVCTLPRVQYWESKGKWALDDAAEDVWPCIHTAPELQGGQVVPRQGAGPSAGLHPQPVCCLLTAKVQVLLPQTLPWAQHKHSHAPAWPGTMAAT